MFTRMARVDKSGREKAKMFEKFKRNVKVDKQTDQTDGTSAIMKLDPLYRQLTTADPQERLSSQEALTKFDEKVNRQITTASPRIKVASSITPETNVSHATNTPLARMKQSLDPVQAATT